MSSTGVARPPKECRRCAYFRNDPAYLETVLPGLTSFGSAHASVRGDDGLCCRHGRYRNARSSCSAFRSREPCVEDTPIQFESLSAAKLTLNPDHPVRADQKGTSSM